MNQSGRMENVREALDYLADAAEGSLRKEKLDAALAEVEEWEDIRDGLERLLQRRMDEMQRIEHRAEAAEAEADRLREALRKLSTGHTFESPAEFARAALAPADRNTT